MKRWSDTLNEWVLVHNNYCKLAKENGDCYIPLSLSDIGITLPNDWKSHFLNDEVCDNTYWCENKQWSCYHVDTGFVRCSDKNNNYDIFVYPPNYSIEKLHGKITCEAFFLPVSVLNFVLDLAVKKWKEFAAYGGVTYMNFRKN